MSEPVPHATTPARDATAAAPAPAGAAAPALDAITVAVLSRSDEPALGRTLAALERAAEPLRASGRVVRFAICVNGPSAAGGSPARAAAEAFAASHDAGEVCVLLDGRADKARAWNLVRGACTTPLLAFCDADVDVAEDALVELVGALERERGVLLVSARQVPVFEPFASERASAQDGEPQRPTPHPDAASARRATFVARAAALPYRFDFQVVGGRLYVMRAAAVERMPESLLLEDGWLSARLGNDALRTVQSAHVRFHPPTTLADYFRERLRTEAGKIQIRDERRLAGSAPTPIARYRPAAMLASFRLTELPLVAVNLGVRFAARAVAEVAARRGRRIPWSTIASSKPRPVEAIASRETRRTEVP